MKSTDGFKKVINDYLEDFATKDLLFAETLKKKNKSIEGCVNYILETVQKSGCNGYADDEIFKMAVHYYDEDNIKGKKSVSSRVVVNHTVELSADEINKAKQDALNKVIFDEKERLSKKKNKKQQPEILEQQSLF